jgi:hypothetical protein
VDSFRESLNHRRTYVQLIGTILLLVILILVGVTVGGGIFVLIAFGLGWLLNHVIHLDPFQATLLSLAGMLAFGFLVNSIFQTIINTMPSPSTADDEDDGDDEEFEVEALDEEPVIYPSIPRWRQPLKNPTSRIPFLMTAARTEVVASIKIVTARNGRHPKPMQYSSQQLDELLKQHAPLQLSGVDLSGANLSHTALRSAQLMNANLSWATLSKATLSEVNLRGAILKGVDLSGANLINACLAQADSSCANLTGVDLIGADLTLIRYDQSTI